MANDQKIKIHFTRSNSFLSIATRFLSASKYSHCELEIDGVCYSSVPFRGVCKQSVVEMFEVDDVVETWTINDDVNVDKLRKFVESQLGKKYDYLPALALGFFRADWAANVNRWFCSELIDAAFKDAGTPLTNKYLMSYRLTTSQLRASPVLDYEGLEKYAGRSWLKKLIRFLY